MTVDFAFWAFILSASTTAWIVGYSLTLLKRTRILSVIFGPIPESEWQAAGAVVREQLQAGIAAHKRTKEVERYRKENYAG